MSTLLETGSSQGRKREVFEQWRAEVVFIHSVGSFPVSSFKASDWSGLSECLGGWTRPVCLIFLYGEVDPLSFSGCFVRFTGFLDGRINALTLT